jgi:hypothetical protein
MRLAVIAAILLAGCQAAREPMQVAMECQQAIRAAAEAGTAYKGPCWADKAFAEAVSRSGGGAE